MFILRLCAVVHLPTEILACIIFFGYSAGLPNYSLPTNSASSEFWKRVVSNEARWIQLPKSFFERRSASNNYHCGHQNSHVIRIHKHRPITIVCITAIDTTTLAIFLAFLSITRARWYAAFLIVVGLLFTFCFQPVKFNARIFIICRYTSILRPRAITVTP